MPTALPPIDAAAFDQHQQDTALAETQQQLADLAGQRDLQAQTDAAAEEQARQESAQQLAELRADQTRLSDEEAARAETNQLLAEARRPLAPTVSAAPATGGSPFAGTSGDEQTALARVYQDARTAGLDDEGARVAQAVARTEGGYGGSVGDSANSAGTFQLYHGGGMGDSYARDQGISTAESIARLRADPNAANQWALTGYLGQAIKAGQAKGLHGADLATYAQTYGQRSVSPERAGANYLALQDARGGPGGAEMGQTSALAPAVLPGAESSTIARSSARPRVEALGQFEQGLPYEEAAAICGPVACYDEQTRVLTRRGFVFFRDLSDDDLIATRRDDGIIEYHAPTARQHYRYRGPMYHFKSQPIDLFVTPNHRLLAMPYTDRWKSGRRQSAATAYLVEASEMTERGNTWFVPSHARWLGDAGVVTESPVRCAPEQWAAFVGLFVAEGSAEKERTNGYASYRVAVKQAVGATTEPIRRMFDGLGVSYRVTRSAGARPGWSDSDRFSVNSKAVHERLKPLGRLGTKHVPRSMLHGPPEILAALLTGLWLGDGTRRGAHASVYTTTSRQLAEDVVEIAIKLGFGASIRECGPRRLAHHNPKYEVNVRANEDYHLDLAKHLRVIPEWEGDVYCATVPNHVLLVERNGRITWCGNSLAFAEANGRNPDLGEARRLAREVGWTAEAGMGGVRNEQALLTRMGVPSRLDENPDFGEIAQDVANGHPVIISTPQHYWFASDYDPKSGRLYVGKTGTSRKGGSAWMTPEQIAQLDGGVNGALFSQNPNSPQPSMASLPPAAVEGDRPPSEFAPPTAFGPSSVSDQTIDPSARRLGPDQSAPITLADVGQTTPQWLSPGDVVAGAPAGITDLIDTGSTAVEAQIRRSAAEQQRAQELALQDFRAQRGQAAPLTDAEQTELEGLTAQTALSLTGEPLAGAGGKAAGEIARLRLDKFPEDIRDTIAQAAERGDFWLQQRRNVISDAQAEKMADELGRTVEQFVAGGRAGRAYNTEETRALRNALTGQAIRVDDLRATVGALGDQASDALRRTLGEEESRLLALSRVAEGARAEAGRAFRAYLADTRGRLARSRVPEYTSLSRVPITAAPELEGAVVQSTQFGPPEHALGTRAPGPVAGEIGPGAEQSTLIDPLAHYRGPIEPPPVAAPELRQGLGDNPVEQAAFVRPEDYYPGPVDPGPRAPPAPGSPTPRVTVQPPLITEIVAGRARQGFKERVYDRASLVRMAGMVSAVPTHLLNIAGNTVMGGLTLASKPLQVAADVARVGVGRTLGQDVARQRYLAEVGPQAEGYARGLWSGVQQVPGILAHGLPENFARAHGTRGLESGSRVLDTAVEAPLRALAASDAVFRGAAFGGHSAALATRQAIQEGLTGAARTRRVQEILGNLSDYPTLLDNANRLAARDVFQEARVETDAISRFKQQHVGAQVAGDVFLPFYKTPYNVAAQGAGMTPAGYLGALAAARRGETGEAVDRAVRATVGTAGMAIGLQLATSGYLTGAYPDTAAERSTLPEGWKPYSLRVPSGDGAVYVPIQSLGALAVPLGASAIVVDAQKRGVQKDDAMRAVYAGLGGIGQFMGDMSALQGLNSVFKLVSAPERTVESAAESLAASFVPGSGFVRQVQQALGDAQRDPQNPVQAFLAGIPGLSGSVPEKLTSLGDARARGPSGWKAFVSGSRIGVEQNDPVLAAYREAGASLSPPGTSVLGHAITPEEQRRVQTRSGELLRERVTEWATDPEFRALGADERKTILDRARDQARHDAGVEVLDPLSDDELARRRAQDKLKRPA